MPSIMSHQRLAHHLRCRLWTLDFRRVLYLLYGILLGCSASPPITSLAACELTTHLVSHGLVGFHAASQIGFWGETVIRVSVNLTSTFSFSFSLAGFTTDHE